MEQETLTEDQSVKKSQNQIAYSRAEEITNIVTHAAGAVLSVVAAVLMILKVASSGRGALAIVSICLYSFALIELYTMSALYHAQPYGKTRRAVFRRFDHCSVAVLIAGTYAPYMLIGLAQGSFADRVWGIVIASVVLAMAVLVMVFNAVNVHKFRIFCMIAYVIMGWACVIRIVSLFHAIGAASFAFLIAGGVLYTAGIVFYRIKKIPFNHAIWHFFVLAGSIMHFVSIYIFLI